jgi:hypothetical protein
MPCNGYLGHPFENKRGKNCVENLSGEAEKKEKTECAVIAPSDSLSLSLDSVCLLPVKSSIVYAHCVKKREPVEPLSWPLRGSMLDAATSH